ncbi:MAG: DUF4202 domain-containing protein [Bacteroidota bacterium]
MTPSKLSQAFQKFDEANAGDPNKETYLGETYPKELLYAEHMTRTLMEFSPNASEALRLAARCQHIRRWEIPRDSYPMDRIGYLKWRNKLKKFHAEIASKIMKEVGYSEDTINEVRLLLEKKGLKKNPDTQTLEDVICLVFLEHYLEEFAKKHPREKALDILRKTWGKMSKTGQEAALRLPLSSNSALLVSDALSG